MRHIFFGLLVVHGLIHFMGFAKAYELAALPQLTQPISRAMGVGWLGAGIGVLAAAALVLAAPRVWWVVGFGAVLWSQILLVSAWSDAKYGTLANVLLLTGVTYGFASHGPLSMRAEYREQVSRRSATRVSPPVVTEADLARLPVLVQRYLRVAGALGQPRVRDVAAVWRGRIRASATDPWMTFTATQYNVPGEPSRFFHMEARRHGLPVDVLHAFHNGSASMRVRLLSLLPLVSAHGPELTRAETVTLFNDLCVLAPATLIDPAIRWDPLDNRSVRAQYRVGPNVVSAILFFSDAGELVDFVSDDRLMASPDGKTFTRRRWSTPVTDYRRVGSRHVATRGTGLWHLPDADFVYVELELLELVINRGL